MLFQLTLTVRPSLSPPLVPEYHCTVCIHPHDICLLSAEHSTVLCSTPFHFMVCALPIHPHGTHFSIPSLAGLPIGVFGHPDGPVRVRTHSSMPLLALVRLRCLSTALPFHLCPLQGRLLAFLGIAVALCASPVAALSGMLAIGLHPTPTTVAITEAARKLLNYALTRPGREMLFTVVTQVCFQLCKGLSVCFSCMDRCTVF